MPKLAGFDMDIYVISKDQPEEQKLLHDELERVYGKSLPFLSDPNLQLIDKLGMKNGETAYRGYAVLLTDGNVILKKVNDHWGEEFTKTLNDIEAAYKEIKN